MYETSQNEILAALLSTSLLNCMLSFAIYAHLKILSLMCLKGTLFAAPCELLRIIAVT